MEQQFMALETRWMNAWKNKDEATARKLIADEFTLTSSLSTGELINKEGWINKAMHHYDCKDFRFDQLMVRVYDKTAVLNIWFHQEAWAKNKDWSGDFLLTDVWIQKNNEWQVVARHSSWLQHK
ncbi:nuclear transport factor 2 family protein [Solitalea lacus]|uniref:nuclear transport factor 2 family protein n=1 Tax=Solitalea lacus TaxID=2911172 RepID=UPI001EDBEF74|nr:nuclear transport factor 2 family protein [Solitalea lacus]UKJ08409.1 nuclear transport factor 2 family protein [Solitalea lacus]